jgi:hypothetical protein
MRQFIVWDPITDDRCLVAVPSEFHKIYTGAVLCAIDDQGHEHGGCQCHSSPFKVALLGANEHGNETAGSVYSSETGIWGDLVPREPTHMYKNSYISTHSTLVGNTLYWWTGFGQCNRYSILAFDLDRQCLAEIEKPSFCLRVKEYSCLKYDQSVQVIQAKDGGIGFAALSCTDSNKTCLQMWERKVNCSSVDTWVLSKSITLNNILGDYLRVVRILRYVEDAHAVFLRAGSSMFLIQLESMQSKELLKFDPLCTYHPFTSFYSTEGNFLSLHCGTPKSIYFSLPICWNNFYGLLCCQYELISADKLIAKFFMCYRLETLALYGTAMYYILFCILLQHISFSSLSQITLINNKQTGKYLNWSISYV